MSGQLKEIVQYEEFPDVKEIVLGNFALYCTFPDTGNITFVANYKENLPHSPPSPGRGGVGHTQSTMSFSYRCIASQ